MKILKYLASAALLVALIAPGANAALVSVDDGDRVDMLDGNIYLADFTFTGETTFSHTIIFDVYEALSVYVEAGSYTGTPGIDNFSITWNGMELTGLGSTFTVPIAPGTYTMVISGEPKYSLLDPNNEPSYNVGLKASAVPLPAAFWLFGSALVGFISFGRRKAA